MRTIEHDCVVNGQLLPKGATVEIPAGFLHSDPEHWHEPEKFIPERYTVLNLFTYVSGVVNSTVALQQEGSGSRTCWPTP